MPQTRRHFTPEFKLEIAKKIVDPPHSIAKLCDELDLGETAARRWVAQYKAKLNGQPLPPGQQHIRQLEAEERCIPPQPDAATTPQPLPGRRRGHQRQSS